MRPDVISNLNSNTTSSIQPLQESSSNFDELFNFIKNGDNERAEQVFGQ